MAYSIPNSSSRGVFPSYKNPPVNEVVCGIRFDTPDKLRISHIGLLWDKFRQKYPIVQHASPIATVQGQVPLDNTTGLPLPRVWFINERDDQLIQFQFDRFYFNWRRRQNVYPRYSYVIKNFENVLNTVVEFFNEFELGELKPIEYELSYINHIPKDQELSKIFSDFIWRQTSERFLPNPVNIAWQTSFLLPANRGRLNVSLNEAVRTDDKTPIFLVELRTRGLSESTSKQAILEWFDLAHEWIVRGFTDLTTPEAHRLWMREEDV